MTYIYDIYIHIYIYIHTYIYIYIYIHIYISLSKAFAPSLKYSRLNALGMDRPLVSG